MKRTPYDFLPYKKKIEEQGKNAFNEMKSGHKTTHWMWYFFPQLEILGTSENSKYYGLKSFDEAKAFLQDNILRKFLIILILCVKKNINIGKTIKRIFGQIDSQKFLSSMTLFYYASRYLEKNNKKDNSYKSNLFKFCKEYAEKELGTIDKKTFYAIKY
jgi:uncharacterized protein (DUF1810 family)